VPKFVADSSVSPTGLKWAVDPVADIVTTAGDLIYGTAADTVARLGIGTAGQVLTVNSGATAPEWGAAAGSDAFFPPIKSGTALYHYSASGGAMSTGTLLTDEDVTFFMPVYLTPITLNRIAVKTGGAFAGTATVRLGIYQSTNGFPTTLLLDAGTVSCTVAGTAYEITISQSISTAGLYYLAGNIQTLAADNIFYAYTDNSNSSNPYANRFGTTAERSSFIGFKQTSVTGAFANTTTTTGTTYAPLVWVRNA